MRMAAAAAAESAECTLLLAVDVVAVVLGRSEWRLVSTPARSLCPRCARWRRGGTGLRFLCIYRIDAAKFAPRGFEIFNYAITFTPRVGHINQIAMPLRLPFDSPLLPFFSYSAPMPYQNFGLHLPCCLSSCNQHECHIYS